MVKMPCVAKMTGYMAVMKYGEGEMMVGKRGRLDGVGWQTEHPAKADAHVEEGGKEAVPDVQQVHCVKAGPPR